ncbi:unnamed protein product [Effrenium voratum]|nr:unnamed protein product [Effrenium voratum]
MRASLGLSVLEEVHAHRHVSSFLRCTRPRAWPDPSTGLPCRDPEEESCAEVHATCAKVPKVGWKPDLKDPMSFVEPKDSCDLPVEKPPPLGGGGVLGKLDQLGDAVKTVSKVASLAQSLVNGGATNSECNARMIDMPYGLNNPEAAEGSGLGGMADSALAMTGGEKQLKAKLPVTLWGQAMHGMSGTWAFDSGGLHSTDYIYKIEQGKGAPDDYYVCDSRRRPQQCALLGGNVKQACAAWYDPRQCDFCEDLGDELKCYLRGWDHKESKWSRVPLYPRDVLGELYRGEWKDVWMRPMFASVRLKKAGLQGEIKKMPQELVTTGPGKDALGGLMGGVAPTPMKIRTGLLLPAPGLRKQRRTERAQFL